MLKMTTWQKTYTRPQPLTKDQLREMLRLAVQNTQSPPKPKPTSGKNQG
jgi:hypothetical protein